jgi:thioredoxin 1
MNKIFLIGFWLICISCQSTSQSISTIKVNEFEKRMTAPDVQLVDVRTADEYDGGHLPNAKNMDVNEDEFATQIKTLDKTKPIFVYCLSGGRSKAAAKEMAAAGLTNITNMDGGVMAWRAATKSLVTDKPIVNNSMSMAAYKALITKDKPVLVEFYAPWCGPCKILKPQVEKIGKEQKDNMYVQFVDVDEHKQLADELKIKSIPILMYYDNGNKKWEIVGAPSVNQLRKKLKI